jgi:hypothetical protein
MLDFMANLTCRPPATGEIIKACEDALGNRLPDDYRSFLQTANGGEGFVGTNTYVILWGADELVPMNREYEVEDYAPGLLIIGSDGGGEAYGFDTRNPQWPVVQVPFVGMEWSEAIHIASSFRGFIEHLYREE